MSDKRNLIYPTGHDIIHNSHDVPGISVYCNQIVHSQMDVLAQSIPNNYHQIDDLFYSKIFLNRYHSYLKYNKDGIKCK